VRASLAARAQSCLQWVDVYTQTHTHTQGIKFADVVQLVLDKGERERGGMVGGWREEREGQ